MITKLALSLSLLALFSGCTSENHLGACVGLSEPQNPKLVYAPAPENILMGIVFFEMIVPPYMVLAHEFYCPTGEK